jgi:hypothetical protein
VGGGGGGGLRLNLVLRFGQNLWVSLLALALDQTEQYLLKCKLLIITQVRSLLTMLRSLSVNINYYIKTNQGGWGRSETGFYCFCQIHENNIEKIFVVVRGIIRINIHSKMHNIGYAYHIIMIRMLPCWKNMRCEFTQFSPIFI